MNAAQIGGPKRGVMKGWRGYGPAKNNHPRQRVLFTFSVLCLRNDDHLSHATRWQGHREDENERDV